LRVANRREAEQKRRLPRRQRNDDAGASERTTPHFGAMIFQRGLIWAVGARFYGAAGHRIIRHRHRDDGSRKHRGEHEGHGGQQEQYLPNRGKHVKKVGREREDRKPEGLSYLAPGYPTTRCLLAGKPTAQRRQEQ